MEQIKNIELFQQAFDEILITQNISNVFQCIISLKEGNLLGYEALCRGPVGTVFENPTVLFQIARKTGKLVELEHVAKRKALQKFKSAHHDVKLFVNIEPSCVMDHDRRDWLFENILEIDKGNYKHIVFEFTEDTSLKDYYQFMDILGQYKEKGYDIAADTRGGCMGVSRFIHTGITYIKIDMELIRDIHNKPFQQKILKCLVDVANESNIKLIGEGIESGEELDCLIDLGVHYGQGYFIQKPSYEFLAPHPSVKNRIIDRNLKRREIKIGNITTTIVGDITKSFPYITMDTLGREVNQIFESNSSIQGLPVVCDNKPVGLIMKHKFYRYLGRQYGYVIFMKRSIDRIMDVNPLTIDYQTPLDRVSDVAMMRDEDSLYDYMIVTKNGKYHGIVTVKDLLQKTTEIELHRAKYANPLTGLPGNHLIEQKLSHVISINTPHYVLYFDLDNFKAYNDVYGFDNGDKVIVMTAEIIQQRIRALGLKNVFVGHVGGDDFVAILESDDVQKLCGAVIEKFDSRIRDFYTETDRKNDYIFAENRHGNLEKFPLTSLSIAVVATQGKNFQSVAELAEYASKLKKRCKKWWKSCYIIE